ncbi:MAG TPA: NADP-dependent oxidoreductase [Sphingomonas sp.]|nr:NADP-dependent oxidoreductase [Sphingomonas sp.]
MTDLIPSFSLPSANRQLLLARRPKGTPQQADFAYVETPLPVCGEGRFLVRNLFLSADPVQRGWAANEALTPLGVTMRALAVGIVVESRDPSVKPGEIVYGYFGWQDYAVAAREDLLSHIRKPRAAVSAYAGVLGMPGVTAWLALLDLAPPKPGDRVLVSTAAGSVGSVVGQIARQRGAIVTGLTGSDEKVGRCLQRYGYSAAFNYKKIDLAQTLAQAAPEGFDVFFDNTGGSILDTAIRAMKRHGRIVQCGTAATASWSPPPTGLRNEREVLTRALIWSGFVIFDHIDRFGEAVEALTDLMLAGHLAHDEDVENGIDRAPDALAAMMTGANNGKKLIYIGDD